MCAGHLFKLFKGFLPGTPVTCANYATATQASQIHLIFIFLVSANADSCFDLCTFDLYFLVSINTLKAIFLVQVPVKNDCTAEFHFRL